MRFEIKQMFSLRNKLFITAITLLPFILTGCTSYSTYLGRTDSTGAAVLRPLDGVKASEADSPNVVWCAPDTDKTIDVVFNPSNDFSIVGSGIDQIEKKIMELQPVNTTNPPSATSTSSYRYFQYAQGVPIAGYKVEEGVNIIVDKIYRSESNKKLDNDKAAPTTFMPVLGRILNPDAKRWNADPEIYTLRQDYLNGGKTDGELLSPLATDANTVLVDRRANNLNSTDKLPPAIIFILYEPGAYWKNKDTNYRQQYRDKVMYFDAYYSIDQWNLFTNSSTGASTTRDKIISPEIFGVCQYKSDTHPTDSPITLRHTGTLLGDELPLNNPKPTLHLEPFLCLVQPTAHCCDVPSNRGDCFMESTLPEDPTADADVKFTLIDKAGSHFTVLTDDLQPSQPDVNLWTKYEFIEMLQDQDNNLTFSPSLSHTAPLLEKKQFSPKNNLRVPEWLFSETAYNANLTPCGGNENCALAHSKYKVSFVVGNNKNIFYHNRTLVDGNTGIIYERSDAHPTSGQDWPWCWFSPE